MKIYYFVLIYLPQGLHLVKYSLWYNFALSVSTVEIMLLIKQSPSHILRANIENKPLDFANFELSYVIYV